MRIGSRVQTTLLAAHVSVALLTAATTASAYPRPGHTTRGSVPFHGGQADLFISSPAISADGRVVAWGSYATDFAPGDANDVEDVFVRDLALKETVRVSVSVEGEDTDGGSGNPGVSGNGRFLSFDSDARNLVPGDTNRDRDIFVYDIRSGTIERVSLSSNGEEANNTCLGSALSHDGRFVAFMSYASNLVPAGGNLFPQIYVRDRLTGQTELVSVDPNGNLGDGGSLYLDISSDGRYVAFSSSAGNVVPGDTNLRQDVFVRDRQTGQTEIVSISTEGAAGDEYSRLPSISDDGRFVAFESIATTLVPQDTNGASDIFVRDRVRGTTRRITVTSSGAEAASGETPFTPGSFFVSISPDGRYAAYQSDAPNLMPNDTRDWDVFIHDLLTGSTTPGIFAGGLVPDKGAGSPQLGADGRYVGFSSSSTNLVPEGNDQWHDAFVHDRGPSVGIGALSAQLAETSVTVTGWATFSGDKIAEVPDAADDAEAPGSDIGSELVGLFLAVRPELGDLFIRWEVAHLPGSSGVLAGIPGVLHTLAFEVAGTRYEVRAARVGGTGSPGAASFALYRCELQCIEVQALSGGYGESGVELTTSLNLASIGLNPPDMLHNVVAASGVGGPTSGVLDQLDQIVIGNVSVPQPSIRVGIAPPGTDPGDVSFDTAASFSEGQFTATVPVENPAARNYELWARACFGAICGPPLRWPAPVQLVRVVSRKLHGSANAFDIELPLAESSGVECRSGGANGEHQLIFTFAEPLSSVGSAIVTSGTGVVSSSSVDASDRRNYVVNLTGVPNAQLVSAAVANITDVAGNSSASVSASMHVLAGDTNEDTRVNVGDTNQTKSRSGSVTSEANFRSDVNLDGRINVGDVNFVKAQAGFEARSGPAR